MSPIERFLIERGGVARRNELERRGIRRAAIQDALVHGAIILVRKGVYAVPGADSDVLTAARHGGEVTCAAALRHHGVWVHDEDDVRDQGHEMDGSGRSDHEESPGPHVWIGPSGRQHPHAGCQCRVHHDRWSRGVGFGFADVLLALLHYAACASTEAFFVAVESALHLGLIGASGMRWLSERVSFALREVLAFADDQSESGLESLLRFRLHLCGISLSAQVQIDGVGRVDFVLGGRIILEVDGRLNHDGPSMRHKDLMRDAAAAAQGYETLRFDYAMILHDWPRVLAAIQGRLTALGAIAQGATAVLQGG
ncbi:DUF559 domain-containing protein [Microbacterium panaciterrae]|uniref:DUF559 domain-containing protein n=1 Tax=Microbacterium panaciterrae TaxID=985759 RepID=UPI0031E9CA95